MAARRSILGILPFVAWTAAPARAEWAVTPYLGLNVGGDVEPGKGGPGGSVGYLGRRLGFELDFQRYQHFFKDADVVHLVPDPRMDFDTDAMSFTGNVMAPIHIRGAANWRPYGTVGVGMIRALFDATNDQHDTNQNDFAFNVGGGVMYSPARRVGLRGDVRYFRALVDDEMREGAFFNDYGFWRATLGVTFRFGS
jgi:opacity protein-like surface antigen